MGVLPEGLARAARTGRLVIFATTRAPAPQKLPASAWLAMDRNNLPEGVEVRSASEIEEGRLREVPAGMAIEFGGWEAFGTPRRPTRLRAWMSELLRRRAVLFLAADPAEPEIREWASRPPHHLVSGEQIGAALDELARECDGASPKAPPPLPAVCSRAGLCSVAAFAIAAALSWLWLASIYGAAENWRWVRLVPGVLTAIAAMVAAAPLWSRTVAAQELPVGECYARTVARWSRRPRALAVTAILAVGTLFPWGLARLYEPTTFLVLYEAAGVSLDERYLGACKGEEPCTLVVPRRAHLHFDGADGGCSMNLGPGEGLVVIDMDQDACEPEPETPSPSTG